MLINYSIQIDMPELDYEILEQIETASEAASNDNSGSHMVEFIICCSILALIAYVLFFKYELVYKITESWKSYSSSDCSDLYKISCQLGGIITFIIDLLLIISYITNINLFSYFGLD